MRGIKNIATKMPLFFRVVSLYVIALIILGSSFSISTLTNNVTAESSPKVSVTKMNLKPAIIKEIIDGEPISIQIDRLVINLPINNGVYDPTSGEWTLSDDAVYYAQITDLPNNQRGNTFLYGHNNKQVLEPLAGLVTGDIAIIKTTNGHIFTYIYTNSEIVPPDLTSILYANPDNPRLTIMTCEGVFSQARRLMYFDLGDAK